MNATTNDWQNDWTAFVHSVARDIDSGMNNEELTMKYGGEPICWIGRVKSIEFDEDPAAKLQMPDVEVRLADGRFGLVNHLYVVIGKTNEALWKAVTPGVRVRFRSSIRKGASPFPAIKWADRGGGKGYISVGMNESQLAEILGD